MKCTLFRTVTDNMGISQRKRLEMDSPISPSVGAQIEIESRIDEPDPEFAVVKAVKIFLDGSVEAELSSRWLNRHDVFDWIGDIESQTDWEAIGDPIYPEFELHLVADPIEEEIPF